MATEQAVVTHVNGQAWVRSADGSLTPLRAGMRIPADAEVVTGNSGSRVVLAVEGVAPVTIGQNREVLLTHEVAQLQVDTAASAVTQPGSASLTALASALDAGQDIFEQLDETAAVLSGSGGDGGSSFTRLMSVVEAVNPLGLAYPNPGASTPENMPLGGAAGAPAAGAAPAAPALVTAPQVAVDIVAAQLQPGQHSVVSFTFTAPPLGFELTDLVVQGGGVIDLAPTADPLVWTGTFVPAESFDGTATVTVPAGSYTDGVGTPGGPGSDDAIIVPGGQDPGAGGPEGPGEPVGPVDPVDPVDPGEPGQPGVPVIGVVTLTAQPSVTEGGSVTYTVTVDIPPIGKPLVVELSNGSTVTIPVGGTTGTVTVPVRADDPYVQGDETLTVTVGGVTGGHHDGFEFGPGTSTVVSDDSDATRITLEGPATVTEGGSITLTARVDNPPQGSDLVIQLTNGRTITIPVGATTGTVTYDVRDDDNLVQGNETQTVGIERTTGGNFERTETGGDVSTVVQDNDVPVISVSNVTIHEGSTGSFTVSFGKPVDKATTVTLKLEHISTEDGDIDLGAPPVVNVGGANVSVVDNGDGTFSFELPANTVDGVTVTVQTNDDVVFEGDEAFRLVVSQSGDTLNGTPLPDNIRGTGIGTIVDTESTDPATPNPGADEPTLTVTDAGRVNEGDSAVFNVSLDKAVDAVTTLTFTVGGGDIEADDVGVPTVTIGGQPVAVTSNGNGSYSIQVPANTTTGIEITVPTTDDGVFEGDESFELVATLTGKTASGTDLPSNITDKGTATIVDTKSTDPATPNPGADEPTLTVTDAGRVNEGDSAVFNVSLDKAVDAVTTLTFTVGGGDIEADDVGVPTVTIGGQPVAVTSNGNGSYSIQVPANTTTGIEITVPTTDDGVFEGDESFELVATLTGKTASGTDLPSNITDKGTATIVDTKSTDPATPNPGADEPTLTVTDAGRVNEGDSAVFNVSLDKAVDAVTTLTFTVGGGDIEADDVGVPTVTIGGQPVAVTSNGNGSYSIQVPANTTTGIEITVPTTDDGVFEGDESFELVATLTGKTASGTDLPSNITDKGTATIVDTKSTDPATPNPGADEPTLTVTDAGRVNEGDSAVFNVSLDKAVDAVTTLTFTVGGGDIEAGDVGTPTVTIGGQPVAVTSNGNGSYSIQVPANTTSGIEITVPTTDDGVYEPDESFELVATLTGKTASGTDLPSNITDKGTATIVDQTEPTLSITGPAVIDEAAGTATYTVTLSHASAASVTVKYGTQDGTAKAGEDYTASSGTLTFAPGGSLTQTITVPITNDDVYEGEETFSVVLSDPAGAAISVGQVESTIVDDGRKLPDDGGKANDDRPTLTVSDVTVSEGDFAVFTVKLMLGTTTLPTSFTASLVSGTATVGVDTSTSIEYKNASGQWVSAADGVTIPAGQSSVQVRVKTVEDSEVEGRETFQLQVVPTPGSTKNQSAAGTGTIIDKPVITVPDDNDGDENGQPVAVPGHVSVAEDASQPVAGTFTVHAAAGLKNLVVGGQTLTASQLSKASEAAPLTVAGDHGTLKIMGASEQDGVWTISYQYTVSGVAHDHSAGAILDDLAIRVTDTRNKTHNATLTVNITDAALDARDDTDTLHLGDDGVVVATGNVVSGLDTTEGEGKAGADQAFDGAIRVTEVVGHDGVPQVFNDEGDPITVQGQHGTLVIQQDGSYVYTPDAVAAPHGEDGGVTVAAYSFDDSFLTADGRFTADTANGTLHKNSNGTFGVKGTADGNTHEPNQVAYANGRSEALAFQFEHGASAAVVNLTNLYKSEAGGEAARWHAFDADGNRLASGVISHDDAGPYANSTVWSNNGHAGTFTVSGIGTFHTIVLEAVPYSQDGTKLNDNSDFFAGIKSYQHAVSPAGDVFIYTVEDRDGSTDSATLTITAGGQKQATHAPHAVGNAYEMVDGNVSLTGNLISDDADGGGAATGLDWDQDTPLADLRIHEILGADGVTVLTGQAQPDGSLSYQLSQGTLVINAQGQFTYTPAADAVGGDEVFHYRLTDPDGNHSGAAQVVIAVPVDGNPGQPGEPDKQAPTVVIDLDGRAEEVIGGGGFEGTPGSGWEGGWTLTPKAKEYIANGHRSANDNMLVLESDQLWGDDIRVYRTVDAPVQAGTQAAVKLAWNNGVAGGAEDGQPLTAIISFNGHALLKITTSPYHGSGEQFANEAMVATVQSLSGAAFSIDGVSYAAGATAQWRSWAETKTDTNNRGSWAVLQDKMSEILIDLPGSVLATAGAADPWGSTENRLEVKFEGLANYNGPGDDIQIGSFKLIHPGDGGPTQNPDGTVTYQAGVTVEDGDSTHLSKAVVTVAGYSDGDLLALASEGSFVVAQGSAPGQLVVTAGDDGASKSDWNAFLSKLTFTTADAAGKSIDVTVTDTDGLTGNASRSFSDVVLPGAARPASAQDDDAAVPQADPQVQDDVVAAKGAYFPDTSDVVEMAEVEPVFEQQAAHAPVGVSDTDALDAASVLAEADEMAAWLGADAAAVSPVVGGAAAGIEAGYDEAVANRAAELVEQGKKVGSDGLTG